MTQHLKSNSGTGHLTRNAAGHLVYDCTGCCDGGWDGEPYACQACGSCCFHIYTASGVCPGSSSKIRLTYTLYPDSGYAGYRGDCFCESTPTTETIILERHSEVGGGDPGWIWAVNLCDTIECGAVEYSRLILVKYHCNSDTWSVGIRYGEPATYGCGATVCDFSDLSNAYGDWEALSLAGDCLGGTWAGETNTSAGEACGGTWDLQIEVLLNPCCKCSGGSCVKTDDNLNSIGATTCDASQDDNCPP